MFVGNIIKVRIVGNDGVDAHLEHKSGGQWRVSSSKLDDAMPNSELGMELNAFIYTDSQGKSLASLKTPLATIYQCANLKVSSLAEGGAFLQWGIEKELLLPFAEQRRPLLPNEYECVTVYLDNSGRLAASSKLDLRLPDTSEIIRLGQEVTLLVYQKTDLGFKAVINNHARGLIFKDEIFTPIKPGQTVTAYIKRIRDDGRFDLSLRSKDNKSRQALTATILEHLEASGGTSSLHDKSPPEEIYAAFNVSKKEFKKALSTLYKQRKISINADCVSLSK
ncbi:MAG: S1-like domain-containing RNA-binding protein [Granulosicoccaceae bacterium]